MLPMRWDSTKVDCDATNSPMRSAAPRGALAS